ncbi:HU family DNA-binding protein [Kribbia dieselivorans]|uniref:HU family DNA-binding protein n=1 Tax=Kribbia dieselivorans TaxID=331526 RepID=UPI000838F164|nr:HU family DNA-binding protein [Kribbia dieselivorans]
MNKADLIRVLEPAVGSRKAAAQAVEVLFDAIVREVATGGRVSITGFGTFEKVQRAARTGRNPRTGDTVRIRKTSVPRFKPGTSFKGYTSRPSSLPKNAPTVMRAAGPHKASTAKAEVVGKAGTKRAGKKLAS